MYGLTDADFLLNFIWSGPYKTSVYYFYAGQFNWNSKRSLSCIIGENILTTTSYCTYTVFVNAVCLLLLWSSFSSCCSCFLFSNPGETKINEILSTVHYSKVGHWGLGICNTVHYSKVGHWGGTSTTRGERYHWGVSKLRVLKFFKRV